jgi:hypothetical protein
VGAGLARGRVGLVGHHLVAGSQLQAAHAWARSAGWPTEHGVSWLGYTMLGGGALLDCTKGKRDGPG